MPKRDPKCETTIVKSPGDLRAVCAQCRAEGAFAFDTEFVMEDRYEAEVCLVQIATEHAVAIIDPFDGFDLAPVWELVADPKVETIVHAGLEDLGLCVQHTSKAPRNIFDVQVAAGLVGLEYPLSLQRLVQAILSVRLHKSKTLTDWRKRPLGDAQLRYAVEDVLHLPAVRRVLVKHLEQRNRLDWIREECARFEDILLYRRADEEKLRRLKGAGSLGGRQLAILHSLMAWRDELAQVVNRPVRTVVKDHLLVEIARAGLAGFNDLRDLRGLNLGDKHLRSLTAVVAEARKIPEAEWPDPLPREVDSPTETALVELAGAVVRDYCLSNDIAYSLATNKRSIRSLVRHHTEKGRKGEDGGELLRGWRGETVGRLAGDVLNGRKSIRVEKTRDRLALRVTPN